MKNLTKSIHNSNTKSLSGLIRTIWRAPLKWCSGNGSAIPWPKIHLFTTYFTISFIIHEELTITHPITHLLQISLNMWSEPARIDKYVVSSYWSIYYHIYLIIVIIPLLLMHSTLGDINFCKFLISMKTNLPVAIMQKKSLH